MPASTLEHRLRAAWQQRGPLAAALWPLSLLYGALSGLRRALFHAGAFRRTRLPVPVLVIGNVVAGGAGKTPTTLAVVAHLRARGWQPGIVSRGYGRTTGDCREVRPTSTPCEVGDEPLLLRQRADVPVFVAARRADAARALLAAHPGCNVLVCDDGLQHLALMRDVQICVFDARGPGNGWLLPAGPLREPWPRPVDAVLWTEAPPLTRSAPATTPAPATFVATRCLADHALRADGTRVSLDSLRGQPLCAAAGIARPEAFFAMLRERGLMLAQTIALPDHFDFAHWQPPPHAPPTLLCTEKDALKLWQRNPLALAVPLVLQAPPAFFARLDERLAAQGYHLPAAQSRPGPDSGQNTAPRPP